MIEQLTLLNKEDLLIGNKETQIRFVDVKTDVMKNKTFSVVSLFSGCGGMDLGFRGDFRVFNTYYEKNNFEILFANDIEKYACETYEENFGYKPIYDDIRSVESAKIPSADVVIGGFPCQDFSHAGNRKGIHSDRGRLYLEMKKVIRDVQPKAFVAENVD